MYKVHKRLCEISQYTIEAKGNSIGIRQDEHGKHIRNLKLLVDSRERPVISFRSTKQQADATESLAYLYRMADTTVCR